MTNKKTMDKKIVKSYTVDEYVFNKFKNYCEKRHVSVSALIQALMITEINGFVSFEKRLNTFRGAK
jgi:hypothetical protein